MKDWVEHLILRSVSKNNELSIRLLADISVDHFISTPYKKAFRRILSYYSKNGRILTWKEIVNDTSLSDKVINRLRSREIKRGTLLKNDASLKLPKDYEQSKKLLERLVTYSQHLQLIKLQNSLSEKLGVDKLSTEDINGVLSFTYNSIEDIDRLKGSSEDILSLPEMNSKELWNYVRSNMGNYYVPTGFRDFDKINVGIPKDSYFLIAAPTGCGKSTLTLQLCINMFSKFGARVCLVPLEMSTEQNLLRVASNLTGISKNDLLLNADLYKKKVKKTFKKFFTKKGLATLDFYTPDESDDLRKILTFLKSYNYDIIFIDYISLVASMDKDNWRSLDLSARFAKMFATKNDTIVSLIAQWGNKKDQVRYAEALVEHASNCFKWITTEEELREVGIINVRQPKARNQDPIPFKLKVNLATSKIENCSEDMDIEDYNKESVNPVVDGFDDISIDNEV